jgi:signal transduction histidine kinase/AraC-like DNA-binding protein/ActR/RegA family two-component response regulator/streptogramin lyase
MLWAGTFDSGVNIITHQGGNFGHYSFDPLQKNGIVAKMIWSFAEDRNGLIWVGTKKGLSRFDPATDTFTSYLSQGKCVGVTDSVDIRSIVAEDNRLWLGTAGGGLIDFDPSTCAVRSYKHNADNSESLSNNHARLLLKDRQNRLWIGTADGLNVMSPERNTVTRYTADPQDSRALPHNRIRGLYESDNGDIWIGTSGGLSRFNETTGSFETLTAEQGLLRDNDVRSVFQDTNGILWIATEVGLTRYDPQEKISRFFSEKDGLSNNTLYGLLPDGKYLWITTNIGLSRFDRHTYSFKNFNVSDGLQSNEFNFNAYLKTRNNEYYVGGVNGFNRFAPQNLDVNVSPPKLNLEVMLSDKDNVQKQFNVTDHSAPLRIQALDHRITFLATVLHYLNPPKNTYQYRLKGFDKDWITGKGSDKRITYPSLPPGEYRFEIQASGSNGVPGETVISQAISVKPPIWKTFWAYILYCAVSAVVLFMAMQIRTVALRKRARFLEATVKNKTLELHQKNDTLEAQSQRLETLLHNQDDFYLRTAHELRTPLTLIRIPAEQLSQNDRTYDREHGLATILRATVRLQRLTDQMLQAAIQGRTHEAGVQTFDLKAVIAPLFAVYREIADSKAVQFSIAPLPAAAITINRQALEDIIHNLLNNALKYTLEGGQVTGRLTLVAGEVNSLQFSVKDDGIGIDLDSHDKIFNRLYRSEQASQFHPQGEGVGLHIVKQHIEACGGHLEFDSAPGEGSEFRVRMPCQWTVDGNENSADENPLPGAAKHQEILRHQVGGQSLLIIEDDKDMQQVLQALLDRKYQVTIAGSMARGLQSARELMPDLVLCDVMLPDGSGFDIIRSLKNSEETSHIPLIILTAVGDLSGKKTGWENGADDYIVKPFAAEDLLLRIAGVLANRKRLQEWYKRKFSYGVDTGQPFEHENKADLDYIAKLEKQALLLIGNGNCGLENLAEAMGQSGRTLQRRLKNIFDYSYTEYIQSVQFKKARQHLLGGSSVKEAAYEAGFSDPAYFSKVFKSLHGISPSLYRSPSRAVEESRQ